MRWAWLNEGRSLHDWTGAGWVGLGRGVAPRTGRWGKGGASRSGVDEPSRAPGTVGAWGGRGSQDWREGRDRAESGFGRKEGEMVLESLVPKLHLD